MEAFYPRLASAPQIREGASRVVTRTAVFKGRTLVGLRWYRALGANSGCGVNAVAIFRRYVVYTHRNHSGNGSHLLSSLH